jgi:hypothetical protein
MRDRRIEKVDDGIGSNDAVCKEVVSLLLSCFVFCHSGISCICHAHAGVVFIKS